MLTINEQIGKKIKELRIEKGLTQTEFANLFSLTQNAVTNIETGKRTLYYEELLSMANYFDVSTDYLIKENGVRDKNPKIQYICDYTGLTEQSVQQLHNWCTVDTEIMDVLEITEEEDKELFLSVPQYNKRIINKFILSPVFNKFIHCTRRIEDVNNTFLSYLALFFGDYDYYCKLQTVPNVTIRNLYNFVREYKFPSVLSLEENKDIAIFKFQKVMNNYLDETSLLQRVSTKNLNGFSEAFSNMCLYVYSSVEVANKFDKDIAYIQKDIKENQKLNDEQITLLKNVYEQLKKEV